MMIKITLIIMALMIVFVIGSDIYDKHFATQCTFKIRIHYINSEQEIDYFNGPCTKLPELTDGDRGYGAAYTEFHFNDEYTIYNVCKFDILSVDTLKHL